MKDTDKMKITVLMTVYNGEKYLARSIESVLGQTYSCFEFLIVDDASTDRTPEMIRQYKDPRIRVIRNTSNQGQTASLNIGLREAQGLYVARIDADDAAFPQWLQSQSDFLKKNGEADVISAGLVTFDEKGLGRVYSSPSHREDILLKAIIKSPINHGGALMKKDSILKIGGYNNAYKIAADYGMWINLLRQNAWIDSNPDVVMAIHRRADSESEKNKLTQTLKEIAEVSYRHIHFLTGTDFAKEDIFLMCQAHYDEGGLGKESFLRAVDIHKNVYAFLRPDLQLDQHRVKGWYKKQARTFFLRRIYWCILKRNRKEVHALARQCLGKIGFNMAFAGIYFISFFPQIFSDFILKAYHLVNKIGAKFRLQGKRFALSPESKRKEAISCGLSA